MVDPGRDRLDPRRLEPRDDLVGREPGGEIDVADRQAEQLVADRAADVAGQAVVGAERVRAAAPCRGCARHLAASSFSSTAACATD